MALTLNHFWGSETGDLSVFANAGGSPDGNQSTNVATGERALSLPANSQVSTPTDAFVSDAGDGHIVGFKVRFSSTSPSVATKFFGGSGLPPNGQTLNFILETDGDLRIEDDLNSATVTTLTTPFTAGTFHSIEVYVSAFSTTATVAVFIDGTEVSGSPFSNVDVSTTRENAWYHYNESGSGITILVDDFYLYTGATAATQRLTNGGLSWGVSKGYRSAVASATDNGSALDAGQWDHTDSLPWDETGSASYTNSGGAKDGSTDCDSGTRSGPSGDADLPSSPTIKGGLYMGYLRRGSGGTTTHQLKIGNSGGDELDTTVNVGNSTAFHGVLTESSTYLPTTSEYVRIGATHSGGARDLFIEQLATCLLYTYTASSNKTLTAAGGSYAISGSTATLQLDIPVTAGSSSYALSGSAATLQLDIPITAESGTYTISGTAASPLHDWVIVATIDNNSSYALTGADATPIAGQLTAAGAGSYAISGTAAGLLHDWTTAAGAGSYAISGAAATLQLDIPVAAESGSYAITGATATAQLDIPLTAEGGSYTITGADATLTKSGNFSLTAEGGTYAISGTAAATELGRALAAAAGSYAITGANVNLNLGKIVTAETSSYTLLGQAASLLHGRSITAGEGSYLISGSDATLTYESGATVDRSPDAWDHPENSPRRRKQRIIYRIERDAYEPPPEETEPEPEPPDPLADVLYGEMLPTERVRIERKPDQPVTIAQYRAKLVKEARLASERRRERARWAEIERLALEDDEDAITVLLLQ